MKRKSFRGSPFVLSLIQAVTQQKNSHPTTIAPQKSFVPSQFLEMWYGIFLGKYTVAVTSIALAAVLILGTTYIPAFAQSWIIGDAPQPNWQDIMEAERRSFTSSTLRSQPVSPLAVDLSTRQGSLDFYNTNYANRDGTSIEWNGDQSSCNAGDVSETFQNQYLHRINYFRAMAGVPADVMFEADYNQKAQQAALMMSANNQLSHSPDASWKCYTEAGSDAAGSSNLFLGMAGVNSVDGYIMDPGGGNGHVGHRRWLLHPATQRMGMGSVASKDGYRRANAIWVFDSSIWDSRPATRDEFVAWPPPGFVPYQVTFARWSFAYPDADFSNATVSMSTNGNAVSVSVEPIANGFGENTFVWRAMELSDSAKWPQPVGDTPYTVTIGNVGIGGQVRDFTYTVTIFDPTREAVVPSLGINFNAAAPGSYLTVSGDGFAANQSVPIELNGQPVQNVQADADGEIAIILNTQDAAEGVYLINAPVTGNRADTSSSYSLDGTQPVRQKENIPGVQTAAVRDIAPLTLLFTPLVLQ